MRRTLVVTAGLALAVTAPLAGTARADAPGGTELTFSLRNTAPDFAGARVWVDGSGKQHVRHLPVHDDFVDASGQLIGSMDRHVNYNVLPGGGTHAWCDLTMTITRFGTFDGSCVGSLDSGTFVGHGGHGLTENGTYTLGAGGMPGIGPYSIDVTIHQH